MAAGRAGERRAAGRRALLALGATSFLHVVVALLIAFARAPDRPVEREAPLQVELVTIEEAPTRQLAQGTPPEGAPPPRRPRRPASPSLRPDLPVSPHAGGAGAGAGGIASNESPGAPPEGRAESEIPAKNPAAIQLFDPKVLEKSVARWRAEKGTGDGGGLGGTGPGGVGESEGDGRGAGEGDGEGPEAERARVSARIARDLEDAQARSRVDVGLVDPYFRELKSGFAEEWHPTAGMLGGVDGDGAGARAGNMLRSWNAAGRRFARTGSPYGEDEKPGGVEGTRPGERPLGGLSGFDGPDFAARWNSGEFAPGAIVLLRLTQDSRGEPITIEILRSSGHDALDESAAVAVREVAAERLSPEHGLGLGGPKIQSVWSFEARLVAKTCSFVPDPTGGVGAGDKGGGAGFFPASIQCGGTFDEVLGKAEVDTPGETKIITRVDLVAVYGGATSPRGY